MIQVSYQDRAKHRQLQAALLNGEAQTVQLDLGRKISVPQDLMMEELELKANRASLMYHERQKRVARFILEKAGSGFKHGSHSGEGGAAGEGTQADGTQEGKGNLQTAGGAVEETSVLASLHRTTSKGSRDALAADGTHGGRRGVQTAGGAAGTSSALGSLHQTTSKGSRDALAADGTHAGKENAQTDGGSAGKTSVLASLQQATAKKGSPDVIAPGYSGPLKEVPRERFNFTVIPKSYHCPWHNSLNDRERILATVTVHLPEAPQKVSYKSFNRAPTPFGGGLRMLEFEPIDVHEELNPAYDRMCHRPDFNRAPRGWGESPEL